MDGEYESVHGRITYLNTNISDSTGGDCLHAYYVGYMTSGGRLVSAGLFQGAV